MKSTVGGESDKLAENSRDANSAMAEVFWTDFLEGICFSVVDGKELDTRAGE